MIGRLVESYLQKKESMVSLDSVEAAKSDRQAPG
jgi:hypothetical protein